MGNRLFASDHLVSADEVIEGVLLGPSGRFRTIQIRTKDAAPNPGQSSVVDVPRSLVERK
jgi:hypothetical protein